MKKSGFTLVELLAVIVILAIIALIATPVVLNIIGDASNKSIEMSMENYIKAVNLSITQKNIDENLTPKSCEIQSDGNLKCKPSGELIVEVDGKKPTSGTIYFKNNVVLDYRDVFFDNKFINKGLNGAKVFVYDTWDGSSATALADLKINETAKTVEINSAADLAGFRDAVNTGSLNGYTTTLNANIDLANKKWTPIGVKTTGSYATNYVGTFDGNGYEIKGINVNEDSAIAGFFGAVSGEEDVTIKNLTVSGSVKSGGKTAAGLVAYIDYNETQKPIVKIDKVVTYMNVESIDAAGGIIGRSYSYGQTYITNSTNNGDLKANNPAVAYGKLGGFIAIHADGPLTIKNCTNNGNASGGTYSSGMLAYLDSEGEVLIEDSINNGDMISLSSSQDLARNTISAGFIGQVANYYTQYEAGTIKNCVNNGKIESSSKAGGIGGYIINMNIIDSINNGSVIVTEPTDKNHNGAGGIVGLAKQSFSIENSVNNGTVTGTVAVGGILGMANMYSVDFNKPYNARFEIKNSSGGTNSILTTTSGLVGRVIGEIVLPEQYKGKSEEVDQIIIGTDKNESDTINAIGGTRYTW